MFHQLGEQMRIALRSIAPFVTKITVTVRQNSSAVDGVFTSTSTAFRQCLVNPFPFSKSREEFDILRSRSGVPTASTAPPTMLRVRGFVRIAHQRCHIARQCCHQVRGRRRSAFPGCWPAGSRVSMSSSVALCTLTVWLVFGAAFVAHHGCLKFGSAPVATEQNAIIVDRFRNLRFICVYQVQLEGTLAKTSCLHLSIGSLEQWGVLTVGMQHGSRPGPYRRSRCS